MRKILRPAGGHILDIDPAEVSEQFWNVCRNVNTRKGFPSRRGGRRIAYPVSAGHAPTDPLHMLNVNLGGFNWWVAFGPATIYGITGASSFDISYPGMQTSENPEQYVSTLLNTIPVFTNGQDPLLYWNGSGAVPAAVLPGWDITTTAKAVAAFRFHLFAFNIDGPSGVFDNLMMWSDAAEPGALPLSWTPSASNEAGSAIIADTPGRIVCGVPLGQQLMTYKPQSLYAVEYAAQPPDNIFTVRGVSREIGALSPHCVKEIGGQRQLVVGNDDVIITDGLNVHSVADNRVKRYLSNMDETYARNAFVVRDLNNRETWVCVVEPGAQYATVAHIWDESRDTWTMIDLNAVRYGTTGFVTDTTPAETWDSDAASWDSDVTSWNAGTVGSIARVVVSELDTMYVEDTPDTITVTAQLAKYDLAFEDDAAIKLLQRVYIRGTGLGFAAVTFRLGSRNSPDAAITWQPSQTLLPEGTPVEISGRYLSIEINVTSDSPWTVDRMILDYRLNGAF